MSFGFGVGDFLAVAKLAKKIRRDFIDAPSELKNVTNNIKNLSTILRDIKDFGTEQELSNQQKSDLQGISTECHAILKSLEEVLSKYKDVNASSSSIVVKSKRVWKRLEFEPKEVADLNNRLTANIALLNTFLLKINSNVILQTSKAVAEIQESQDNHAVREENLRILNWLTPIEYIAQLNDSLSRRQDGTGQWLLDSSEYQCWLDGTASSQILYCPGMPGVGKSMLSSIAVEDLLLRFSSDPNVGIAYVFVNFKQKYEQKLVDLWASFTRQFLRQSSTLPSALKQLYEKHSVAGTRPSFKEMRTLLIDIISSLSQVFMVVDALDEFQTANIDSTRFVVELLELQNQTKIRIMATSRQIPAIMQIFEGKCVALEVKATESDLEMYLRGHMAELPRFVQKSDEYQGQVIKGIIEAVNGIFLLAQLHMDSLKGVKSIKTLRIALANLPQGSNAYDFAYDAAVERIRSQSVNTRDLAELTLSWVICSKVPLTTLQLQHALAIEIGESSLDEDNIPELEDAISACAGLVIVDGQSHVVRAVHYTTQEYFERTLAKNLPQARKIVTESCLTYLDFDAFEWESRYTDSGIMDSLDSLTAPFDGRYPLYNYIARYWIEHYRDSSDGATEIPSFLQSVSKVRLSRPSVLMMLKWTPSVSNGLELCALHGLTRLVESFFKEADATHDAIEPDYGTTLNIAASGGYALTFEVILDRIDKVYGSKHAKRSAWMQSAFQRAVVWGSKDICKMLLNREEVNPNLKDEKSGTLLVTAARFRHEAVIRLLLEQDGADPNWPDGDGQTPLIIAAEKGDEAIVRSLLARDDINVDPVSIFGQTPLNRAAFNGHSSIVDLLLRQKAKADLDPPYCHGTPLFYAAREGQVTVVEQLIERDDVRLNWTDSVNMTPLSIAAMNGHAVVVKLLIEKHGVAIDHPDNSGQTPLGLAAKQGHDAVVELLIAKDRVTVDWRDIQDRTPLMLAAIAGHGSTVKLLVDGGGVDVNTRDSGSITALQHAVCKGHGPVVKVLVGLREVKANVQDSEGYTLLHLAAKLGHSSVVKELLALNDSGADIHDQDGRTPLGEAIDHPSYSFEKQLDEEALRLLVERTTTVADVRDSILERIEGYDTFDDWSKRKIKEECSALLKGRNVYGPRIAPKFQSSLTEAMERARQQNAMALI